MKIFELHAPHRANLFYSTNLFYSMNVFLHIECVNNLIEICCASVYRTKADICYAQLYLCVYE